MLQKSRAQCLDVIHELPNEEQSGCIVSDWISEAIELSLSRHSVHLEADLSAGCSGGLWFLFAASFFCFVFSNNLSCSRSDLLDPTA